MLSALSRLGISEAEVYSGLANEAVRRADELSPRDIADIARAFAIAGTPVAQQVFQAFHRPVVDKISSFSSQDLSQVVLAYVTTATDTPELMDAVADAAFPGAAGQPACMIDLTRLAKAFGMSAHVSDPAAIFSKIAGSAERRLEELNPRCLGILVHAFAAKEVEAPKLMAALAQVAEATAATFRPQDIAFALTGFAAVGETAAFGALGREAVLKFDGFAADEFWAVRRAFTSAGEPMSHELEVICQAALSSPDTYRYAA